MSSSKPTQPKGTRDFGPEQAAKRNYIVDTIKTQFIRYGFSQIETPAMENLSVLTGKYGDEGDQLLFKILNSGDFLKNSTESDFNLGSDHLLKKVAEKGLRYDLTVPFARFIVQNQHQITMPFKRFQIQPVWRADKPQKGRYREFYQCDADIVGSNDLWNEAELSLLIHDVFENLNYDGFVLKINHRELLNEMARVVGLAGKEMPFCITIDKLDKIGAEKVNVELEKLGANDQLQKVISLFDLKTSNEEKLNSYIELVGENRGTEDLSQYFKLLAAANRKNMKIELDLSLARGLTYYTGTIFEVKATDVTIGSITGGGRYDNLTGVFGLKGTSGVGISFGLDRIYDVLEEKDLFPSDLGQSSELLIAHFDETSKIHGLGVLAAVRNSGIRAEIFPDNAKIKKQFNYADKKRIPFVLVIGSEEIKTQTYALKDMKSGTQESMSLEEILNKLAKMKTA